MPELSLQGQKIRSQVDAGGDKGKGSEQVKVGRYERITIVSRLVKSSVWLWQKVCMGQWQEMRLET